MLNLTSASPQRRLRLTYANVMSTIAVLIALGTGGAWAAGTINGRQIVNRSITHTKIGTSQVRRENIKPAGVVSRHIATGAVGADQLADGSIAADEFAVVPRAAATDTETMTVADATWTTLPFAQEDADSADIHSTAVNTSRFVARRDGVYLATARILWSSTLAGLRWTRIVQYDAADVEITSFGRSETYPGGSPFSGPQQEATAVVTMHTGDYLQMEVRQDAEPVDGDITINGDPQFTMTYLSAL